MNKSCPRKPVSRFRADKVKKPLVIYLCTGSNLGRYYKFLVALKTEENLHPSFTTFQDNMKSEMQLRHHDWYIIGMYVQSSLVHNKTISIHPQKKWWIVQPRKHEYGWCSSKESSSISSLLNFFLDCEYFFKKKVKASMSCW